MQTSMRRGFTLVEMLVVIIIIGILAAILVPTVGMAIRRSKNTAMAMEVNQLSMALEAYKLDRHDYPPDFSNQSAIVSHLRRAFPRARFNVATWMGSTAAGPRNPRTLDAAEALVFWLSLTTDNPRNPISGKGDAKVFYDFRKEQLTDLDNDGWPEYVPNGGPGAPFVYFDGRLLATFNSTSAYAYAWSVYPSPYTTAVGPPANLVRTTASIPSAGSSPGVGVVRPYRTNDGLPPGETKTWPSGPSSPTNNTFWINPGTFQVVCAGLDNHFGYENSGTFKKFPGPNYYSAASGIKRAEDVTNISSFSDGKTIGDSFP
ncbi:MAG: prepilin-type N-terminal cleavage/methylation domain-containing protein [Pirellulaceae bacterium]|nr:prepilin-type N-terminal cleavage/methylation domain-containing protein [Pirellulaceae bacterium]HJN12096.1 prepilin-type N-terminal cleavage/methylation domain-containing protein [Pirellulaceae bacterium]